MNKVIKPTPTRDHEAEFWSQGHALVAGVDEVGRGCIAGPVVAAAVVLPPDCQLTGVRDSKLVTKLQRQKLSQTIKSTATAIGVGWATPGEIDELGLTKALKLSAQRALVALGGYNAVILDGKHDYLSQKQPIRVIVRADQCCLNVAAASIIAKVARDNYMTQMHQLYPAHGFDQNAGYGTRHHLDSLSTGMSPIHRRSVAPVARMINGN